MERTRRSMVNNILHGGKSPILRLQGDEMQISPDKDDPIKLQSRVVQKEGSVGIPQQVRDEEGLGSGDWVDVVVEVCESGVEFDSPDLQMNKGGSITIPARQRRKYSLESGDTVDVTIIQQ